jgi:hypothetical protein
MSFEAKIRQAIDERTQLAWRAPPKRCLGHRMVITLAMKMANEEYERYAHNNAWYAANPQRKPWVLAATPYYTEPARATLAGMLAGQYPEHLKQKISEALIMDNAFRGKRDANQST